MFRVGQGFKSPLCNATILLSWGKQSFSDESKSAVLDSVTRLSAGTGWREKEKALEDVTGVYYYNAVKIQEMFQNAVSSHRQNRAYYSPLHTSIMAVGVWRIRPAIDELMQVIADYLFENRAGFQELKRCASNWAAL